MAKIKSYQEQIQDIVSKAIDAVEGQHKAVAEASFSYAKKLYQLDAAKSKHDEYATIAYTKVREVNEKVGSFAGDLIAKYEKPETTTEKAKKATKTAAKKTTAAAKKATTTAKTTAKKATTAAKKAVAEA